MSPPARALSGEGIDVEDDVVGVLVVARHAADAAEDPRPEELAEAKLLRDALRRLAALAGEHVQPPREEEDPGQTARHGNSRTNSH